MERYYEIERTMIYADQRNLPDDVLQAIPFHSIKNSGTGGPPQDLWQQVTSQITNAVVSVADFIYNGLVALGNLIEKAATIVGEFYMKLWNTAVSAVKTAVEVVKKVVDAMVQGLINLAKEIFSPVVNKIKEMMSGFYNYLKGQIEAIANILQGKPGKFTLLNDVLHLPGLSYLLTIPTIITAIYWAITAASAGIGAIVLNLVTMALPVMISLAMGGPDKSLSIPVSGEDVIKMAWEKGLGIGDTTKLSDEQKISIISSMIGFTVSKLVMETVTRASAQASEVEIKIEMLEEEIKDVMKAMNSHWSYDDTFKSLENDYKSFVEEKERLYNELNNVNEIALGKKSAQWGFGFSVVSVILSLLPIFASEMISSAEMRAILLGFSVGIGVGGITTSVGGLTSTDRGLAFLSGVGIASSLVGIGVSIYEITQN